MQLQNIQIVYLYKLKTPEQDLAEQDVLLPLLLLHVEQSLDQPHWSKFLFTPQAIAIPKIPLKVAFILNAELKSV